MFCDTQYDVYPDLIIADLTPNQQNGAEKMSELFVLIKMSFSHLFRFTTKP